MTEYQTRFHRYHSRSGSRFSATVFLRANDIRDALDRAELMIAGMKAESPEDRFTVASLEHRGLRGEEASEMGQTIWETDEEIAARREKAE